MILLQKQTWGSGFGFESCSRTFLRHTYVFTFKLLYYHPRIPTVASNIEGGVRRRRRAQCCGISADDERREEKRISMLSWFADFPGEGHIYSIHNICQVGMKYVTIYAYSSLLQFGISCRVFGVMFFFIPERSGMENSQANGTAPPRRHSYLGIGPHLTSTTPSFVFFGILTAQFCRFS